MAPFNFADQYREAGLSPSAEAVRSRQEPFEKLRQSLDAPKIIDLTRLYFGLPLPGGASWFRDGFAESDESFSFVDNARETAVLASCLLSAALEEGNVMAGLAPLTAAAGRLRPPVTHVELLATARKRLLDHAERSRRRAVPTAEHAKQADRDPIAESADQLAQGGDWTKAA